jgi:hypothetical protein
MMSFADYGICMIVVNSQMDDWHPVSRYCSTNLQGFGEMVFLENAYEIGCNCHHCCMTHHELYERHCFEKYLLHSPKCLN